MTNIELKAQVTETEDKVYIDGIPPLRFGEIWMLVLSDQYN